jgi:hypothetical protein
MSVSGLFVRRKVKKVMKEKMTKRKKEKVVKRNRRVVPPLLLLVKNHQNANKTKQHLQLYGDCNTN